MTTAVLYVTGIRLGIIKLSLCKPDTLVKTLVTFNVKMLSFHAEGSEPCNLWSLKLYLFLALSSVLIVDP